MAQHDPIPRSVRYQVAWNEITARVVERDRISVGYIVVSASLLGVAFSREDLRALAVMIPYVAFAVALVLSSHEYVMLLLTNYLRRMVGRARTDEDSYSLREWAAQATYVNFWLRIIAVLITMTGFSVAALLISSDYVRFPKILLYAWRIGWVVLVVTIGLMAGMRIYRIRQWRR